MDLVGILGKIGFDFNVFLFNLANFAILAFLLKKFFFGKIVSVIDERNKIIEDGLRKSEYAEQELEEARKKAEQEILSAQEKSRSILNEATDYATKASEEIKNSAVNEASTIVAKAKQVAEKERLSLLEEVRKDAAQIIADEVANKINSANK